MGRFIGCKPHTIVAVRVHDNNLRRFAVAHELREHDQIAPWGPQRVNILLRTFRQLRQAAAVQIDQVNLLKSFVVPG